MNATGRRGLAGVVFAHKIAGAMAAKGCSLNEIVNHLKDVCSCLGTIGVSLSAITLPGNDKILFNLEDDVYSLGLGIHGEMGAFKEKLSPAKDIVATIFDHMTSKKNPVGIDINNSRLAVIVNNLGGLSNIELTVFANEVLKFLIQISNVEIKRVYIGSFMTSLNMNGASISVLKLNDDLQLQYLDFKTSASGWKNPAFTGINNDFELLYAVPEKNYNEEERKISLNMETQLK